MKRSYFLVCSVCFLLLTSLFYGCGGTGSGSPGSKGTEDTGVEINATITPVYLGDNAYSVDVFQDVCDLWPPPEFEDFTDHNATVTINASLINPNTSFQAGILYI
jgi:hypothetical protein